LSVGHIDLQAQNASLIAERAEPGHGGYGMTNPTRSQITASSGITYCQHLIQQRIGPSCASVVGGIRETRMRSPLRVICNYPSSIEEEVRRV